jgi:hypothetical protein
MLQPIYCFEVKYQVLQDTINTLTGFAISNYNFEKVFYGVNKTFITEDLMHDYNINNIYKFKPREFTSIKLLEFNQVLIHYNHFVEAVRISNLTKPKYCVPEYMQHCHKYKTYYEIIIELLQLIIAKWDDWN